MRCFRPLFLLVFFLFFSLLLPRLYFKWQPESGPLKIQIIASWPSAYNLNVLPQPFKVWTPLCESPLWWDSTRRSRSLPFQPHLAPLSSWLLWDFFLLLRPGMFGHPGTLHPVCSAWNAHHTDCGRPAAICSSSLRSSVISLNILSLSQLLSFTSFCLFPLQNLLYSKITLYISFLVDCLFPFFSM